MTMPNGWVRVELGDIVRPEYGKGLPSAERNGSGQVPLIGSAGVLGYHDVALVDGPVVVVGRKGNAGAVHLSLTPCWPIDTTYFLRVPASIDAKFIAFQVSDAGLRGLDSSTAIPSLRRPDLERAVLLLPPLAEQRRIVAAIEEQFSRLDAAEEGLERVLPRLAAFREQAVGSAFRGDWSWTTLGEIADIVGGVTKDSKRQADPSYVEVPYLRVANVQRGYLDLGTVAMIRVPPDKAVALRLVPGDVLFNEGGDRDKLGRGWVWSGEVENCIHQNHVFRARLRGGFDPRFVSWHGNTYGRAWFEKHGRQTTNLASLNRTTLSAFPVPSPPLEEQCRIVAEIDQQLSLIDSLRAAIDAAQKRSAALRRAILERAFRGELVQQDPNDEPSSALLERIRAERAAAPKPTRKRVTA